MDVQPLVKSQSGSGEHAAAAMAAKNKAEVEAAYVMACSRPRNWFDVRVRLLDACKSPGFAAGAFWRKPVGNKMLDGPSIRFAEVALQCMRNVRVSSTVIYEDSLSRTVNVRVTDLEANLSYDQDVSIEKTVERRKVREGQIVVSSRQNTNGETVYLVEASEEELTNKIGSAQSKVIRNSGLRLLPQHIKEEAIQMCQDTANDEHAKDPQAALKRMTSFFASCGVTAVMIETYVGHPLSGITASEGAALKAMYEAIKDGESSWSDYADADGKPLEPIKPITPSQNADKPKTTGTEKPPAKAKKSAAATDPAQTAPAAAASAPATTTPASGEKKVVGYERENGGELKPVIKEPVPAAAPKQDPPKEPVKETTPASTPKQEPKPEPVVVLEYWG